MKAPNGITSWVETHHEVVCFIARQLDNPNRNGWVWNTAEQFGTVELYDLGEEWTDMFEAEFKGREWDGEFIDVLDNWLQEKNEMP